ncbi:hypothetical protein HK096_007604, partial [Nowakowskiella sp. JEL0078]
MLTGANTLVMANPSSFQITNDIETVEITTTTESAALTHTPPDNTPEFEALQFKIMRKFPSTTLEFGSLATYNTDTPCEELLCELYQQFIKKFIHNCTPELVEEYTSRFTNPMPLKNGERSFSPVELVRGIRVQGSFSGIYNWSMVSRGVGQDPRSVAKLKDWMSANHVDSFIDFLCGVPHNFFSPNPKERTSKLTKRGTRHLSSSPEDSANPSTSDSSSDESKRRRTNNAKKYIPKLPSKRSRVTLSVPAVNHDHPVHGNNPTQSGLATLAAAAAAASSETSEKQYAYYPPPRVYPTYAPWPPAPARQVMVPYGYSYPSPFMGINGGVMMPRMRPAPAAMMISAASRGNLFRYPSPATLKEKSPDKGFVVKPVEISTNDGVMEDVASSLQSPAILNNRELEVFAETLPMNEEYDMNLDEKELIDEKMSEPPISFATTENELLLDNVDALRNDLQIAKERLLHIEKLNMAKITKIKELEKIARKKDSEITSMSLENNSQRAEILRLKEILSEKDEHINEANKIQQGIISCIMKFPGVVTTEKIPEM